MRKLSILGSTGSIGTQTLEVVRNNPEDFSVVALTCGSKIDLLYKQILEFKPLLAACSSEEKASELRSMLSAHPDIKTEIISGADCNITAATIPEADTVVGAMVGIAGLEPTYNAILKGKDIALANKETLVTGGEVIMPLVAPIGSTDGVQLLPVDSEHCAIWQCLWGEKKENLDRILITASGGSPECYS